MAMSADVHVGPGRWQSALKLVGRATDVRHIDATPFEFQALNARDLSIERSTPVDVAGDSHDRRDGLKLLDDLGPTDVAGVQNLRDSSEMRWDCRMENAVCI